jgi:hypothetical protein
MALPRLVLPLAFFGFITDDHLVQQTRCDELRKRLSEACTAAGVTQPLPPDFSLPPILKAA